VLTDMQADEATRDMLYVLDRVIRTDEPELSEREIYRETRSRFNTAESLRPVLANLIDRRFLAPMPEPDKTGPGRPKSRRFAVHPKAPEYGTQWSDWTQPLGETK
jgi:hypothetical protein